MIEKMDRRALVHVYTAARFTLGPKVFDTILVLSLDENRVIHEVQLSFSGKR